MRAYQLLVPQSKLDPAGFNAQSAVTGPSVLNFSYFVAGGGYSTLAGIVNLESSAQSVTLTLRGSDGAIVKSPQTVQVPGNGRAEPDLATLFGLAAGTQTQGWLKIEGTGKLSGYLTYATEQALAAVVSMPEPRTQLTFSHVAEAGTGFFTGLALLNTNTEAAAVTILVYKSDGQLAATSNPIAIAPNGQRVGLLNQLVGDGVKGQAGGYVIVKSTLPIHGIEIFGTDTLSAMANVPAQ